MKNTFNINEPEFLGGQMVHQVIILALVAVLAYKCSQL